MKLCGILTRRICVSDEGVLLPEFSITVEALESPL